MDIHRVALTGMSARVAARLVMGTGRDFKAPVAAADYMLLLFTTMDVALAGAHSVRVFNMALKTDTRSKLLTLLESFTLDRADEGSIIRVLQKKASKRQEFTIVPDTFESTETTVPNGSDLC